MFFGVFMIIIGVFKIIQINNKENPRVFGLKWIAIFISSIPMFMFGWYVGQAYSSAGAGIMYTSIVMCIIGFIQTFRKTHRAN